MMRRAAASGISRDSTIDTSAPAPPVAPPVAPPAAPAPTHITRSEAEAMVAANPNTISIRESRSFPGRFYTYDTNSTTRLWLRD